MKLKYFCIFCIMTGQVVGAGVGYYLDPSWYGVYYGLMASVCVLFILALNVLVIGSLLGLLDG